MAITLSRYGLGMVPNLKTWDIYPFYQVDSVSKIFRILADWPDLAWPGPDLTWYDLNRPDLTLPGLTWPDLTWPDPTWPGLTWPGLTWPVQKVWFYSIKGEPRYYEFKLDVYRKQTDRQETDLVLEVTPQRGSPKNPMRVKRRTLIKHFCLIVLLMSATLEMLIMNAH